MHSINSTLAIKIIFLFALLNSSIFLAFQPNGFYRLPIAIMLNVSTVLLIVCFFKIIFSAKVKVSFYFKFMFTLLFIWIIITIYKSIHLNTVMLMSLFGHYLMGWAWITPMAVVCGFNIFNWLVIFNFFKILLFIGALFGIGSLFYPTAVSFGLFEYMAFLPIFLLTYFYQTTLNKKIILFSVVSFLILSFSMSQRINFVFIMLLSLFLIFEVYREPLIHYSKKIILSVVIFIITTVVVIWVYINVDQLLSNRGVTSDTRTFLVVELFSDMSLKELVLGRGALGTYYSPYFEHWNKKHSGGDSSTRSVNEIGYLEIILKGGFVMLLLYLLILLPAAYIGIFKSKNIISRMSGYYITSYLIVWTISYYPVYSVEYLLLWMAVGTIINNNNKNMDNRYFLIKKKRSKI
jgi:hypothetical protein